MTRKMHNTYKATGCQVEAFAETRIAGKSIPGGIHTTRLSHNKLYFAFLQHEFNNHQTI